MIVMNNSVLLFIMMMMIMTSMNDDDNVSYYVTYVFRSLSRYLFITKFLPKEMENTIQMRIFYWMGNVINWKMFAY